MQFFRRQLSHLWKEWAVLQPPLDLRQNGEPAKAHVSHADDNLGGHSRRACCDYIVDKCLPNKVPRKDREFGQTGSLLWCYNVTNLVFRKKLCHAYWVANRWNICGCL